MQRFGVICGVAIVAGVVALAPAVGAQPRGSTARPWMNTSLSAQQRAKMLRAQMTLAEKIDLMTSNPEANAPYAYYNAPIPRLGIPALKMADAGGGVAPRGWSLPGTGRRGHGDAVGDGVRRDLVDGAGAADGRRHRRGGARDGPERAPRPGHRHRAGAVVRPHQRERGRGAGTQRHSERGLREGRPGAPCHRDDEALHRLQPGDEPQRRAELGHRRARVARGVRARLRDGHPRGEPRCRDVLLQQDQRRRTPARTRTRYARCSRAS